MFRNRGRIMDKLFQLAGIILIFTTVLACSNTGNKENKKSNRKEKSELDLSLFLKKGKEHALATKKVLGRNLIGEISSNGTESALSFCNIKAQFLTDSMTTDRNVRISRVSDQYRNPNNQANENELIYINQVKAYLRNKEEVKPQLQEINGKMVGYYPIMTNMLCLQCHGIIDEDISPSVLSVIAEKYPEDKAVGYANDELRGIWVIEMDKKMQ